MSVAMAYHKGSKRAAQAENDEPIFPLRMVGIWNEERVLIEKHRLRFLERYAVFPSICRILAFIPFEPQLGHSLL